MSTQSPGEQAARESLHQSVGRSRREGAMLADETISMLRSEIRMAINEGIQDQLTEENFAKFWDVGLRSLQNQAAQRTGLIVGGLLAGMLKKGALFVILGGIVYAVGGWTALAALFKALLADRS